MKTKDFIPENLVDSVWKNLKEKLSDKIDRQTSSLLSGGLVLTEISDSVVFFTAVSSLVESLVNDQIKDAIRESLFELSGISVSDIIIKVDSSLFPAQEQKRSVLKLESEKVEKYTPQGLNREYTFDSFFVSRSNEFAYTIATAVGKDPGQKYNPLFIYGGVGVGKTHLMQAIGNQILRGHPSAKVTYVTSERFLNDYLAPIRDKRYKEFREKYRELDVLLIDDVQFFGGKPSLQEEFFHTFNELESSNKQIVMTADKPPTKLHDIEERLISRFNSGLSVDIQKPDFELRLKFLQQHMKKHHLDISDDLLIYIAERVETNIRELECSFTRIMAYASFKNLDVEIDIINEVLHGIINEGNRHIDVQHIQEYVCKAYNISMKDLLGRKRTKEIVLPRMIAMYLAKEITKEPLKKIGECFGGRDHTTVMNALDRIRQAIQEDDELQRDINTIIRQLKS